MGFACFGKKVHAKARFCHIPTVNGKSGNKGIVRVEFRIPSFEVEKKARESLFHLWEDGEEFLCATNFYWHRRIDISNEFTWKQFEKVRNLTSKDVAGDAFCFSTFCEDEGVEGENEESSLPEKVDEKSALLERGMSGKNSGSETTAARGARSKRGKKRKTPDDESLALTGESLNL